MQMMMTALQRMKFLPQLCKMCLLKTIVLTDFCLQTDQKRIPANY
jgi:hypothetical protein